MRGTKILRGGHNLLVFGHARPVLAQLLAGLLWVCPSIEHSQFWQMGAQERIHCVAMSRDGLHACMHRMHGSHAHTNKCDSTDRKSMMRTACSAVGCAFGIITLKHLLRSQSRPVERQDACRDRTAPAARAPETGDRAMTAATATFLTSVSRFSSGVYASVAAAEKAMIARSGAGSCAHQTDSAHVLVRIHQQRRERQ